MIRLPSGAQSCLIETNANGVTWVTGPPLIDVRKRAPFSPSSPSPLRKVSVRPSGETFGSDEPCGPEAIRRTSLPSTFML